MDKLISCYLVPHPPIMVPEIGKGEERKLEKTIKSLERITANMRAEKPQTVIVITPHGCMFSDAIAVSVQKQFVGDFSQFGQPGVSLEFNGDTEMSYRIMEEAAHEGIPVISMDRATAGKYRTSLGLDHGALVPLYYINKGYQGFDLVHITYGLLSPFDLYRFGKCVQKVIEGKEKKVSILCSGDLSHRLTKDAPAGYSKKGAEYDQRLISLLGDVDVEGIITLDPHLIEEAGECAYRAILIMLGAIDGFDIETELMSYEGPFGVGYCVASFKPLQRSEGREYLSSLAKGLNDRLSRIREQEDEYVRLARRALEAYVTDRRIIEVPEGLPPGLVQERAGVFVSIKKNGQLRGCIGTIHPTTDSVAREIINNAISAGTRDPRFYPVTEQELKDLVYSVDVLEKPEPVDTIDQLDVKRYGVIVKMGRRSGLLLPNLEGIDSPEEQVRIALQKAGISPIEPYSMERFEVTRHY